MIKTVNVDGRIIEYEIVRKKVKNINMRITADSPVRVTASQRVSVSEIERALRNKAQFIFKAKDKCRKVKEGEPQPLKYEDGEKIKIHGKLYTLKILKGKSKAFIKDDSFILTVKDTENFILKQRVAEAFLRQLITDNIRGWLNEIFPEFESFGIAYPEIEFRRMKARWASCHTTKGKIVFSTGLVQKSEDFCRYVIIHELVHFIHPNHSKKFYDTVKLFMSDYEEIKKREAQI